MALLCGLGQVTLHLWAPHPPQCVNEIGFLTAWAFLESGGMEGLTTQLGSGREGTSSPNSKQELQPYSGSSALKPNQVGETSLYGVPIVSLVIDGQERLCLAQISNTLLKNYSYNEIHNRRVALGITCVQCTPVQLEILRRAGAMPISSRRCGMITKREAERLCKSFLGEHKPPKLPENFAFDVVHECAWGSRGSFIPARYNSSRAKCIKCGYCSMYFSPNKFIFHSHRTPDAKYTQPDAANFNSWRRHLKLSDKSATDELSHAWEDVKAMFNGGTRKRTFSLQGGGGAGGANGGSSGQAKGGAGSGGAGGPGCGAEMAPGPPPHKSLRCGEDEAAGPAGPPPPHPQRGLGLAAGAGGPGGPGGPGAGAGVRSYPVIPVPSKGFGLLQKLPPPLFPHPYGFPTAFGLCPKKDDPVLGAGEPKGGPRTGSGGGAGTGGAGGPGAGHLPPGGPGQARVAAAIHEPDETRGRRGVQPASRDDEERPRRELSPSAPSAERQAPRATRPLSPRQPPPLAPTAPQTLPMAAAPGPGASRGHHPPAGPHSGTRRPTTSPPSGGYELREPCVQLGGPAPAKVSPPPAPPGAPPCSASASRGCGPGPGRVGLFCSGVQAAGLGCSRQARPWAHCGAGLAGTPSVSDDAGELPEERIHTETEREKSEGLEEERPREKGAHSERKALMSEAGGGGGPVGKERRGRPFPKPGPSSTGSPEFPSPPTRSSPRVIRLLCGDRRAMLRRVGHRRLGRSGLQARHPLGVPPGRGAGLGVYAPERDEHVKSTAAALGPVASYLCIPEAHEPDKEDNHSTADDLETRKSYPDQRSISQPSPANTERGEESLTLDVTGTQLVEKDIENLAREELQKLLLEQMELRKKLEREFQSLKDNFQDQMKRELAYREEMVQQLQIVRDTLCNELDQERKARYAIQQKLKEAHDALHHFSCKMLTPRHCTGNCSFKPPLLP
uniref:SKI family transcriptional corepressor 1 n=1 Tax=Loxodonta africana TaxID=9785 RepID=G3TKA8_LOXAF